MQVPPAAGLSTSTSPGTPAPGSERARASSLPVAAVPPAKAVGAEPHSPFARAGVDVGALLASAGDALVARRTPSTAALADVLERARAALVRGAAQEALATLDEVWEGATRTEGGWYYRASALAALGRMADAERVLQLGLTARADSAALQFLRSLLQHAVGDLAGALRSQQAAAALRNEAPLLSAWRAVLLAQQGDRSGAAALVEQLRDAGAPPALLEWTRATLAGTPARGMGVVNASARDVHPGGRMAVPASPLERALEALGGSLAGDDPVERHEALQRLIRDLSAGGTLHGTARPSQVAAARSLLASLLSMSAAPAALAPDALAPDALAPDALVPDALAGGRRVARGAASHLTASALDALADTDGVWRLTPAHGLASGSSPGQQPHQAAEFAGNPTAGSARSLLIAALRDGRLAEARRALSAMCAEEPAVNVAVAEALIAGAERTSAPAAAPAADVPGSPPAVGTWLDPLLTPIRLGLALLHHPSAQREAAAALGSAVVRGRSARRGSSPEPLPEKPRAGAGAAGLLAVGCLLGAALAIAGGALVVALPLLGAAGWLGVTGIRRDDTP